MTVDAKAKLVECVSESHRCGILSLICRRGKVIRLLCGAHTLRRANTIQLEYSPFDFGLEKNDVLKTSRELSVRKAAYSPLASRFVDR